MTLALWQQRAALQAKQLQNHDAQATEGSTACLQVATDALTAMEKAMARDKIDTNDRQLACARISSQEGQDYLKAMACAANFAWVNRSSMTFLVRQAFAKMFHTTPDDLDMHLVYDVSHNIAKVGDQLPALLVRVMPLSMRTRGVEVPVVFATYTVYDGQPWHSQDESFCMLQKCCDLTLSSQGHTCNVVDTHYVNSVCPLVVLMALLVLMEQ